MRLTILLAPSKDRFFIPKTMESYKARAARHYLDHATRHFRLRAAKHREWSESTRLRVNPESPDLTLHAARVLHDTAARACYRAAERCAETRGRIIMHHQPHKECLIKMRRAMKRSAEAKKATKLLDSSRR